MRRRSDWRRAIALVAMAGCWLAAPAQSQGEGEGEALDDAQRHVEQGHPSRAAVVLLRLSQAGQVPAMERLALLHWYGPVLFPGEAWRRETALLWFARAAEQGSALGAHMLTVPQRAAAPPGRDPGR
jgi:TPR repeat protein